MKKLLTCLLVGLMVASLTPSAFAKKSPAATQKVKTEIQQKKDELKILKQQKKAEQKAWLLAKPKVLQGWVSGIDVTGGFLLLKKQGAQGKIAITAKTVVTIIDLEGAHVGALTDFAAGDKVFALVRRGPTPQQLTGLVVVKMPVKPKGEDNDDEDNLPPPAPAQCADTLDNDADGLVDLADPGCADAADNDETDSPPPPTLCADTLDNDADGLVDLADPGCADAADNDETDPVPAA